MHLILKIENCTNMLNTYFIHLTTKTEHMLIIVCLLVALFIQYSPKLMYNIC